jgi:hypothetical protein
LLCHSHARKAAEPSWESNGNKSLSSHVRWGERGAPVRSSNGKIHPVCTREDLPVGCGC